MPDAKRMSGVPLPVGDLPVGTVVVRVVRGVDDQPIAGQSVTLVVGWNAANGHDERGRTRGVQRASRAPGQSVRDRRTARRLESQEFAVPATGGIRVALVATDPEIRKRLPKIGNSRRVLRSPGSSCSAISRASCSRWATSR